MHQDEFHHCPRCQRRTRHRVSRERKLAPVLWCQSCFHVQVVAGPALSADPLPAMAAFRPTVHDLSHPLG